MVQRYVWFDDIEADDVVRIDLRLPRPLKEFLAEVAKRHRVSMNGVAVAILAYAADADAHKRLKVHKVNDVRVTEAGPDDKPVAVPVLDVGPAGNVTYRSP